jgi:hypothetical protein
VHSTDLVTPKNLRATARVVVQSWSIFSLRCGYRVTAN